MRPLLVDTMSGVDTVGLRSSDSMIKFGMTFEIKVRFPETKLTDATNGSKK